MVTAALALLAAGAGCAGDDTASRAAADPPPEHVHGLGVNPADEALYMATHTGLFRMERGSTEAASGVTLPPPAATDHPRCSQLFRDRLGFLR